MDAETNVESMSFTWEADKKRMPILLIQEQLSKAVIPIPVPDVTPLSPPLGIIPPIPKHFDFIAGLGKYSFLQAAVIGLTKAAQSADAAFGTGKLDVLRYGRVLKARQLVGVRGVGQRGPARALALRAAGNPLAAARHSGVCPVRQ